MILIDSWPYDLMVKGELSFPSEVTTRPVEDGSTKSDSIVNGPMEFTLESIVSDTPIGDIANHESRRVDEVTDAVFGSNQSPLPSDEAYNRLLEIRRLRQPVTIEIPLRLRGGRVGKRLFTNMALEDLKITMDAESSGGLFFSATFKEVEYVINDKAVVKRTVTGGRGPTHTATVGKAYNIDDRIAWRMGVPPGAPLQDNYSWAIVVLSHDNKKGALVPYVSVNGNLQKEEQGLFSYFSGDQKLGSITETSRIYRWAGTSGSAASVSADAQFQPRSSPNERLTNEEVAAFQADLARDQKGYKKNPTKFVNTAYEKTHLPEGLDLSRVKPK